MGFPTVVLIMYIREFNELVWVFLVRFDHILLILGHVNLFPCAGNLGIVENTKELSLVCLDRKKRLLKDDARKLVSE